MGSNFHIVKHPNNFAENFNGAASVFEIIQINAHNRTSKKHTYTKTFQFLNSVTREKHIRRFIGR